MRLLIVLILLVPTACCGLIWTGGGGGGDPTSWSDDFSVDTIDSTWMPAEGDQPGDCEFTIDTGTGKLDMITGHPANCDNTQMSQGFNVDMGSPDHWACITPTAFVTSTFDADDAGLVLRAASATSTTAQYRTYHRSLGAIGIVRSADDSTNVGFQASSPYGANEEICFQVKGTGVDTVFASWIDPLGANPTAWGDPDWCLAEDATTFVGTVSCWDSSMSFTGALITDTGNYVHVFGRFKALTTGEGIEFDDFRAGIDGIL